MQEIQDLKSAIDELNGSIKGFSQWFDNYNQEKKNQQKFGIENFPARVFRKTIDLSTAGVFSNTGLPFNGAQVEKIYSSTTGASVSGSVKLNFDRAMIDSNSSYKTLQENDSFVLGFSTANAFLSWDAQPGVLCDIVFFNDVDYRSGSQKTSITGTVSVSAQVPSAIVASATGASYTVPAGKYAKATLYVRQGGSFTVNGTTVLDSIDLSWNAIASNASPRTLTITGGLKSMAVPMTYSTTSAFGTAQTGSGVSMAASSASTTTDNGDTFTNATARETSGQSISITVPAGTVIVGTAGTGVARYVIEEYSV